MVGTWEHRFVSSTEDDHVGDTFIGAYRKASKYQHIQILSMSAVIFRSNILCLDCSCHRYKLYFDSSTIHGPSLSFPESFSRRHGSQQHRFDFVYPVLTQHVQNQVSASSASYIEGSLPLERHWLHMCYGKNNGTLVNSKRIRP